MGLQAVRAVAAAFAVAASTAVLVGQATYSPPRTPWGDPDLQGIWPSTDMVGVPFERPERFGTRLYLTDQELKEREAQASKQAELDVLDFDLEKPPAEIVALGDVGGVTSPPPHWLERGVPSRQSSLVVEPANGRLPPMTVEVFAPMSLRIMPTVASPLPLVVASPRRTSPPICTPANRT